MNNKSVLITGSSKGLGKELALVFAKNNYDIILHGRDKTGLYNVAKQVNKYSKVKIIEGDLKSNQTLNNLYEAAKQKSISILINNAAVHCPKLPLEELTETQIEDMLLTNLNSPIKLTKKIYSNFLEKKCGTIIIINSISGLENQMLRSIFCASKWGLKGFTDTLRLEAKKNNIRVIGVYPSRIKTIPKFQKYGMETEEVAQKIYTTYKNTNEDELILDGRLK